MTNNAWNTPYSSANGQILIGRTGNRPLWSTLIEGANTTITNGPGSVEIAFSGAAGDWVFISSATASGSSSITFTGLNATYSSYVVDMQGVQPATNEVEFWFRTSTNGGSSYDSAAASYAWDNINTTGAGFDIESNNSDTKIRLVGTGGEELGTGSNETLSGRLWIFKPSAAEFCKIFYEGMYNDDSPDESTINSGGCRITAADVDAIQFLMETGNIASGTFKLYGLTT